MSGGDAYRKFLRPLLFLFDPERVHELTLGGLRRASRSDLLLRGLRRFQSAPRPQTVFGLTFPNPIGLAAGFDKNGVALPAWEALGFGFIEIGTVTAKAQMGNPKPRIFRFPEQHALINHLGFNNDGADVVANRLRRWQQSGRWPKVPVGINIGKSKTTPIDQAPADYLHSFRRLQKYADYIVLNVSSPNTPALRTLQEQKSLDTLLRAFREENRARKPLLIKIAPDLSITELEDILAVSTQNEISGIIATNTTVDHAVIPKELDQTGGLSGVPLRAKSSALVREIVSRSEIPVIASGGIFDLDSAKEKMEAGAQLFQIYTGYVFEGPTLLREIVDNLSSSARESHE